jgi:hypothetical protein
VACPFGEPRRTHVAGIEGWEREVAMIHVIRWTLFILMGSWSLLSGAPAPPGEPRLAFDTPKLSIKGTIGKDAFAGSFHVRTGGQEVKELRFLTGDLTAADGKRIAASQYQLTPLNFPSIEKFDGKAVNVSVNGVTAPGTYSGTIEALFTGHDPGQKVTITLEVVAVARTDLEVAGDASVGAIRATRRLLPWGDDRSAPASFSLRNKGDSPGKLAQITVLGPSRPAVDVTPIPPNAVVIQPAPEPGKTMALEAGLWSTFNVQVNTSELAAGHYAGVIEVMPDGGEPRAVALDVQVRDGWFFPLLVLLVGVGFSWLITWMLTTGGARMKALGDVDQLRAVLQRGDGLPADLPGEAVPWPERLAQLDEQARKDPPAVAQAAIDAFRAKVEKAQETSAGYRRQLREWLADFDRWAVKAATDADVAALLASPLVTQVRQNRAAVERLIAAGHFPRGTVEGLMQELTQDMATLTAFIDSLPKARASTDAAITPIHASLTADLRAATSLVQGRLGEIITLFRQHHLMAADAPAPALQFVAPAAAAGAPPGLGARLRTWFTDPRQYLPLLSRLLGLLFLFLLLSAGMLAMYADKPTFGAHGFGDYLGLLLWGIGADASRKQLKDLESATSFLGRRLGLQPGAPGH